MAQENSKPEEPTNDMRHEAEEAVRIAMMQQAPQTARLDHQADSEFEDGMVLRLEIQGSSAPILVNPGYETVLGRRDPIANDPPDLDLTPYAAYQLGLSRRHAVIMRIEEKHLYVSDLDSRNGTYLNGQKLSPNQPQRLQHGDEIRMGKMLLRLFFQ